MEHPVKTAQFDIETFDIAGNYALQASAGTGKTYSIVQIVGKLLDAGIPLEQLLLVTYTEKAAGELKERIREKAPTADVDNAMIGTIHSFCQRITEEFCISAGKPSKLELASENELSDFVAQYIRRGEIYEKIAYVKAAVPEEEMEEKLTKAFSECLKKYYLDRDYQEVSDIVSMDKSFIDPQLIDDFVGYHRDPRGFIYSHFSDLKAHLDALKNSTNTKKAKLNGDSVPLQVKLSSLYDLLKDSVDLYFKENTYKKSVDMTPDEAAAMDYIKDAKDTIRTWKSISYIRDTLITTYIGDLYQKWQERKEQLHRQTYGDMLRNVREEVVSGGALLDKLREKFRYCIIDEFQDTNQVQWDIFKKVFLSDDTHHVIVVGDPKQSIYSFQGADVTVYEKAVQEIAAKGGLYRLGTNYRSTRDVVDSTNEFFEKYGEIDDCFEGSNCGRDKMKVTYDGEDTPAFWIYEKNVNEEKEETAKGNKKEGKSRYAKAICEQIMDCCTVDPVSSKTKLMLTDENGNERPVSFKDFAILARVSSEMESIERALEKCGIPYVRYKDPALFTGRECAHWIALLDAIDAPDFTGSNRVRFRKAQYTFFFGRTLEEIKSVTFDKDNIPEIELFEKWKQLAAERRWEEMIDAILLDTALGERMSSLKYLKSYGVMKQLGEYCIDYLSNSNSITSLVKNLRKRQEKMADGSSGEEAGIIAKSTDFDCVQIMTIHAAKGLEFPIVISAAGFKDYPNNETGLNAYHDAAGQYVLSFISGENEAVEERNQELRRLIYVAYTRAKYVLMLPEFSDETKRKVASKVIFPPISNYKEAHQGDGKYRPFCETAVKYEDIKSAISDILNFTRKSVPVGAAQERQEQLDKLKEIIKGKFWHSSYKYTYSSLSHDKAEKQMVNSTGVVQNNGEEADEEGLSGFDRSAKQVPCRYDVGKYPIQVSESYPAGAELGNALHEVLEAADYQTFAKKDPSDLLRMRFEAQGFPISRHPEWVEDSRKLLCEVLKATLPTIHGANLLEEEQLLLSTLSMTDRKNEVEFNFNRENEKLHRYFNGFIDLIFKCGEYYSVLDWKSDRLNEDFTSYSDAGELKKHVDFLYSIQRVLYSYCLIKWLKQFYPDLSEEEIFEQHFGGVYYVFLRGCNAGTGNGIYAQTWNSFADLEKEYRNVVAQKVDSHD